MIALVLFGAKKLKNVGSDLGAAVRGFKKAVNDGDDEQTKQLTDLIAARTRTSRSAPAPTQVRQQAERLIPPCSRSGFTEILLIFAIALLVLGPARLPKLAADVGRWAGRARSMARQLRTQLEQEVQYDPLKDAAGRTTDPFATPAPTGPRRPSRGPRLSRHDRRGRRAVPQRSRAGGPGKDR